MIEYPLIFYWIKELFTYKDLKESIFLDLRDTEKEYDKEIDRCFRDTLREYVNEPFYTNQIIEEIESDNNIIKTDYIDIYLIQVKIGSIYLSLDKILPDIDNIDNIIGQPLSYYQYGNELRVYPKPDRTYTYRIYSNIKKEEIDINNIENKVYTDDLWKYMLNLTEYYLADYYLYDDQMKNNSLQRFKDAKVVLNKNTILKNNTYRLERGF